MISLFCLFSAFGAQGVGRLFVRLETRSSCVFTLFISNFHAWEVSFALAIDSVLALEGCAGLLACHAVRDMQGLSI